MLEKRQPVANAFPPTQCRARALPRRTARRTATMVAIVAALLASTLPTAAQAETSGGWTTTSAISSETVAPGDSLEVTASVTSEIRRRALVDVEVYSVEGEKVHQRVWDRRSFRPGTTRTFSTAWELPSDAREGDYVVKIGIFDTDWSPLHHWNDQAAMFEVVQAASAEPSHPTESDPTDPEPSEPEPSESEPTEPEPSPSEPSDASLYEPIDDCSEGTIVPLGQAPDAVGFEPLGSIWCFNVNEPPAPSAVQGENSWVDEFDLGGDVMYRFDDGDLGYRVFNSAGSGPPDRAQHFVNQNHWMTDARGGFTGGTSLSPDRSFTFQDGKFVLEADVAASIPEYGGDTWTELTITSAPAPTGEFPSQLYAYGQFGGHWSVGCRLQPGGTPVCAVFGPEPNSPQSGDCAAIPGGYRVAEFSWWQQCGESYGGSASRWISSTEQLGDYWRDCEPGGMDMACRDRFRMEVTKDSIALYVNGVLYFRDRGWPATHHLPTSFLNGDVYAYQSNWQVRTSDRAYRYHWDRFAVNPPSGPTASPSFP